jgi:hypothetical protein
MTDNNRCRLCLKPESSNAYKLYDVLDESVVATQLVPKIVLAIGVHLEYSANVPNQICKPCRYEVHSISNFKELCMSNQTLLQEEHAVGDRSMLNTTVIEDAVKQLYQISVLDESFRRRSLSIQNRRSFIKVNDLIDLTLDDVSPVKANPVLNDEKFKATEENINIGHEKPKVFEEMEVDTSINKRQRKPSSEKAKPKESKLFLENLVKRLKQQSYCHLCQKFYTKYEFENHLKSHSEKLSKKRFGCPVAGCCKKYTAKNALICHIKTEHLKYYYRCSKCEEKFKHESETYKHIRVTHKGGARPIEINLS